MEVTPIVFFGVRKAMSLQMRRVSAVRLGPHGLSAISLLTTRKMQV